MKKVNYDEQSRKKSKLINRVGKSQQIITVRKSQCHTIPADGNNVWYVQTCIYLSIPVPSEDTVHGQV